MVGLVASSIALKGSGVDEFWFRLSTFVRLESLSLVGTPSKTMSSQRRISTPHFLHGLIGQSGFGIT